MPKRTQESYESDGGFIEDAPQSKKRKGGGRTAASAGLQKDDNGDEYWEISRTRRVQLSTFKGNTMVNIREFYEKDGKVLPGKKGISLSIDQYTAVLDILPEIESILKSRGITVARPKYDGVSDAGGADEEEVAVADGDGDADAGEEQEKKTVKEEKKSSKLDKVKLKANHEATSDEEE